MFYDEKNKENWLNEALKAEPKYTLPNDFAHKMAGKIEARLALHQYLREFGAYVAVVIGVALVLAGIEIFWLKADWKSWLQFLTENVSLIAGINFLLVFILFTDRVILRYFMHLKKLETN